MSNSITYCRNFTASWDTHHNYTLQRWVPTQLLSWESYNFPVDPIIITKAVKSKKKIVVKKFNNTSFLYFFPTSVNLLSGINSYFLLNRKIRKIS